MTFGCSENAAVGAFSGEGAKNGSKSYKLTFNNGGANAIAFPNFLPEAQANTDWSEAKARYRFISIIRRTPMRLSRTSSSRLAIPPTS